MLQNRDYEERPWGSFTRFTHNEESTVKILDVKPGSKLSLQYHKSRDEFWHILSGRGQIVIGDDTYEVEAGEEYIVMRGQPHRITTQDSEMRVLEISLGEFDENDNIRLEDDYGRV